MKTKRHVLTIRSTYQSASPEEYHQKGITRNRHFDRIVNKNAGYAMIPQQEHVHKTGKLEHVVQALHQHKGGNHSSSYQLSASNVN
jgi:hypothetical protein